jgi:hypothetical protein
LSVQEKGKVISTGMVYLDCGPGSVFLDGGGEPPKPWDKGIVMGPDILGVPG